MFEADENEMHWATDEELYAIQSCVEDLNEDRPTQAEIDAEWFAREDEETTMRELFVWFGGAR